MQNAIIERPRKISGDHRRITSKRLRGQSGRLPLTNQRRFSLMRFFFAQTAPLLAVIEIEKHILLYIDIPWYILCRY